MNEIDDPDKFYKKLAVEKTIRIWSDNNSNCYFIALFAGCREIYRHIYHNGCVGASTKVEAEQKFKAIKNEEEKKKLLSPLNKVELYVIQKKINAELRANVDDKVLARIEEEV